eukprot:760518-Hanusia_phi.AAC.1
MGRASASDEDEHKHARSWEETVEAVWRRHARASRFPQREDVRVTAKRIVVEEGLAVVERKVVYNYSELVPLLLQGNVNPADKFVLVETMKFRWKERNLEIVAVNETGRSSVMYEEAVQFYPHPENSNWTVMRQCGSYEVDLFFGLETMGLDMCRSIFRMNFNNNVDADASMMQEYVSNKEVPGYFPTYLRDLFLQDTDPSLLPPLPPQDGKTSDTELTFAAVKANQIHADPVRFWDQGMSMEKEEVS